MTEPITDGEAETWPRPADGADPQVSAAPTVDLAARWAAAKAEPSETAEVLVDGPGERSRAIGRFGLLAVLVAVVLAAALVWTGLKLHHQDQLASARTAAIKTATADALLLSTYSYTDLRSVFAQIEARSIPSFAAQFKTQSSAITSALDQYKAGSKGSTSGVGIESASTDKATVLVFLNQTVTNSKSKSTTERSRMTFDLVLKGGKWLIANAVLQ